MIDGLLLFVNPPSIKIDLKKCGKKQRFEMKMTHEASDRLGAFKNSSHIYSWNFLLPSSFTASKRFTHVHQIHIRGMHTKMPLLTHTISQCKGIPRGCLNFELRYSGDGHAQETLMFFNIYPYLGKWLTVKQKIKFSETDGHLFVSIKHKQELLLSFSKTNIRTWQIDDSKISKHSFHYRPKWGIYRGISRESLPTSIFLSRFHLNNSKFLLPPEKIYTCSFIDKPNKF